MPLILLPTARLRPYVEYLWEGQRPAATDREHVLPNGTMHIALRLQGGAVRLHDDRWSTPTHEVGDVLVAGARSGVYWKDASVPTRTVGVQLRPGAAQALFKASAADFSNRHVRLDELWGYDSEQLRERLHQAPDAHAQLVVLEAALLARLKSPRALHPAIAQALEHMQAWPSAARLPPVSGISQRHFISQFRDATGLSPKLYARVRRFRHLLQSMQSRGACSLAELALAAGYSDQSHCNRDFLEFSGFTPHAWRLRHCARHQERPRQRFIDEIGKEAARDELRIRYGAHRNGFGCPGPALPAPVRIGASAHRRIQGQFRPRLSFER